MITKNLQSLFKDRANPLSVCHKTQKAIIDGLVLIGI